ncbi:hypothetical protein DXG01_014902 [Tephrocybe rancida]|nr:hypothetical protein DXG01_014902 [Tephrocybe rancida]
MPADDSFTSEPTDSITPSYTPYASKYRNTVTDSDPKILEDWEVKNDGTRWLDPSFFNQKLDPPFASNYPPVGYTAEEIMQFKNAKELFKSLDEIEEWIAIARQLKQDPKSR